MPAPLIAPLLAALGSTLAGTGTAAAGTAAAGSTAGTVLGGVGGTVLADAGIATGSATMTVGRTVTSMLEGGANMLRTVAGTMGKGGNPLQSFTPLPGTEGAFKLPMAEALPDLKTGIRMATQVAQALPGQGDKAQFRGEQPGKAAWVEGQRTPREMLHQSWQAMQADPSVDNALKFGKALDNVIPSWVKLTGILGMAMKGLEKFGESTVEGYRGLEKFSGNLAVMYAQLDRTQLVLGAQYAQATGGTAAMAGGELRELKEALQPLREMGGTMKNIFAGAGLFYVKWLVRALDAATKPLQWIAKGMEWIMGSDDMNAPAAQIFEHLRNPQAMRGPHNRRPGEVK